jgi:hypothetical protein
MGAEGGILALVIVVCVIAVGAVAWNSIFGSAAANLAPANNSSTSGSFAATTTTTSTIGSLLPWVLIIAAALLLVGFVLKFASGGL